MKVKLDKGRLTPTGILTIAHAEALRDALVALLNSPAPHLTVNLELVEDADLATLQVLLAARMAARQAGKPLSIIHPSQRLQAKLAGIGLDPQILS